MVQRSLYLVVATATCVAVSNAFVPTPSQQSGSLTSATHRIGSPKKVLMETSSQLSVGSLIDNLFSNPKSPVAKAKELVQSLVEDEKCFATEAGAVAFGNACADDVVYEDCFEPKPFVGKSVSVSVCVCMYVCLCVCVCILSTLYLLYLNMQRFQ